MTLDDFRSATLLLHPEVLTNGPSVEKDFRPASSILPPFSRSQRLWVDELVKAPPHSMGSEAYLGQLPPRPHDALQVSLVFSNHTPCPNQVRSSARRYYVITM